MALNTIMLKLNRPNYNRVFSLNEKKEDVPKNSNVVDQEGHLLPQLIVASHKNI